MIKNNFIFSAISILTLIFMGCERRRDFCECMNVSKLFTDELTLSKKELETKEKECAWIQEELSQMEILQKMSSCHKVNSIEKKDSSKTSDQNQNIDQVRSQNITTDSEDTIKNKIQTSPTNIQNTSTRKDLEYMFAYVGKFTRSAQILSNPIFKSRLQSLLGSKFNDLQNIYDNSATNEIEIPDKNYPNEIWMLFLDNSDLEGTSVMIVVDPSEDFINVNLTIKKKSETFYENGKQSNFFKAKFGN